MGCRSHGCGSQGKEPVAVPVTATDREFWVSGLVVLAAMQVY